VDLASISLSWLWTALTKIVVFTRDIVGKLPSPWDTITLAIISIILSFYIIRSRITEFTLAMVLAAIIFLALKLIGA